MRVSAICRVALILAIVAALDGMAHAEQLPQDHPYQRSLRAYLATLGEKDFAVDIKPFTAAAGLDDDELFRAWLYTDYDYGGLRAGHLRIPASQFTLAAIEGADAVMAPPVNAMSVAELVIWNNPGNPYYNSRALRNRAFVASVIDMVMLDQLHEQHPGNIAFRSDYLGGTLIWMAYVDSLCKADLPAPVWAAYEEGLRKAIGRIDEWGPRGTMTDMDLFASVSLWYASQALNDPKVSSFAERYARRLYTDPRHFHPAGFFVDDHCFDASYNGISLFFAGWAANASDWPFVKEAVAQSYRLRGYLCLPEPDHQHYYGPTHFNSRCSSDSHADQWGWLYRNMGGAMVTDYAMPFTKLPTSEELKAAPTTLTRLMNRDLEAKSDLKPQVWKNNLERIWTTINFAAVYCRPGFYARLKKLYDEQSPQLKVPWDRPESFVENFENTLLIAKFPAFGVVIHTGTVAADDPHWHRPVGMGGGALSAFWTPAAGPALLGRRRGIQGNTFDSYDDWRLWPTHAITGVTADGKVISSARTRQPESDYDVHKLWATVQVRGTMANTSAQGQATSPAEDPVGPRTPHARAEDRVLKGAVAYTRRFRVDENGLDIESTVTADGQDTFAELYEVIPVFLGDGYASRPPRAPTTEIRFQLGDQYQEATAQPQDNVRTIQVRRQAGTILITLSKAARVRLSPEPWVDGYLSSANCRNIMVDLLSGADRPVALRQAEVRYRIQAGDRRLNVSSRIDEEAHRAARVSTIARQRQATARESPVP